MKHYINENMWSKLEAILMECEIPYRVSFDSHIDEKMETIIYDKYIYIEPVIIQKEEKVVQ